MTELKLLDGQKIKKLQRAVAIVAVCATLGCGAAEAMPSGAELVAGNVDVTHHQGGDASLPASGHVLTNGDTLTVTKGPAIINWESFMIDSGDSLTLDTSSGALLNRVGQGVGITGEIIQTGANPCWIICENGITVGYTATFNVQNLVLSTIDLANDDFLALANGTKQMVGLNPLTPQSNNVMTFAVMDNRETGGGYQTAQINGSLTAYTSIFSLADGVSIEVDVKKGSSFIFNDAVIIPETMQQAVIQEQTNVSTVLANGSGTASGQNAGPVAMEGNGQPGATEAANEPAAVDNLLQASMDGIGHIENGQFELGQARNPDDGVAYVGVGDVTGAVTMNVWETDAKDAPEAGGKQAKENK